MSIVQKIIGSGMLFFISVGTGIWLICLGKPYNTAVLTVHKLTALAAVLVTAFIIHNLFKAEGLIISLMIVAGFSVLALFVSGALLSIGKEPYMLIKTTHIIASIMAVGTITALLYILISRR